MKRTKILTIDDDCIDLKRQRIPRGDPCCCRLHLLPECDFRHSVHRVATLKKQMANFANTA